MMPCLADSHPYVCGCPAQITPEAAPEPAAGDSPAFRRSAMEGASDLIRWNDSPGAQVARQAGQAPDAALDDIADVYLKDRVRGHRTADGLPRDQAEIERLWRHARAAAGRGPVQLAGDEADIARQFTLACPDMPMSAPGTDARTPAWSKIVIADDHGNYVAGSLAMYGEFKEIWDARLAAQGNLGVLGTRG